MGWLAAAQGHPSGTQAGMEKWGFGLMGFPQVILMSSAPSKHVNLVQCILGLDYDKLEKKLTATYGFEESAKSHKLYL